MIETLMARSQKPPTAITPLQGGGNIPRSWAAEHSQSLRQAALRENQSI